MLGVIIFIGGLAVISALIAQTVWERTRPPLQPMTTSAVSALPQRFARQAAREHRRVWIKYREPDGQVMESSIEIYHATWTGHILGWCYVQRRRRSFQNNRILAWKLLDERFERSAGMERWSRGGS